MGTVYTIRALSPERESANEKGAAGKPRLSSVLIRLFAGSVLRIAAFVGCGPGEGNRSSRLAYFETGEAAHRDVFPQLADLGGDKLCHRDGLIFDERLLVEADFLVELAHLAFHDLLDDLWRLASCGSLGAVNVFLALVSL